MPFAGIASNVVCTLIMKIIEEIQTARSLSGDLDEFGDFLLQFKSLIEEIDEQLATLKTFDYQQNGDSLTELEQTIFELPAAPTEQLAYLRDITLYVDMTAVAAVGVVQLPAALVRRARVREGLPPPADIAKTFALGRSRGRP